MLDRNRTRSGGGAPKLIQLPPFRPLRGVILFYFFAPILFAPMLQRNLFQMSARNTARAIAGNYVPFLTMEVSLYLLYRFLWPSLVTRARTLTGHIVVHATVGATAAVLLSFPMWRLLLFFCDGHPSFANHVTINIVMTWLMIVPALWLPAQRERVLTEQRRVLEERQATLRAQLEALQARTNPHFLFNALDTVASLIHDRPDLAERTLERLADILRYALQSSRLEMIPLAREVEMVKDYLAVQQARFGARLRYTLHVQPGLEGLLVPPLLLQPLVENAVLHGISGRRQGGHLRLHAQRRDDDVELRVDDDGPGPGASSYRGSGTSLHDLRQRLALVYGETGRLALGANASGGCTVAISLPWAPPRASGAE